MAVRPLNEGTYLRIVGNHFAGRHDPPRPQCWYCLFGDANVAVPAPEYQRLYIDRRVIWCADCRMNHFQGGRCFLEDERGRVYSLGRRRGWTPKEIAELLETEPMQGIRELVVKHGG